MKTKQDRLNQKVLILSTGGTIEKSYDESEGTIENKESIVHETIVSRLRLPYTEFEIYKILAKDSLQMTDEDRLHIVNEVKRYSTQDNPIVILHGTDTMDQTARTLVEQIQTPRVPVVLTGAMKPMKFEDSDAKQNLIEAIYASKICPPGIYLSFHGELYLAPGFRKNRERGTFELLP